MSERPVLPKKDVRAALRRAVEVDESDRAQRVRASTARILERGFWTPTTQTGCASVHALAVHSRLGRTGSSARRGE